MFVGLALVAIGTILLLERLGVIRGGLGTYWPVLLIIVGVSMLLGRRRGSWGGRWQR